MALVAYDNSFNSGIKSGSAASPYSNTLAIANNGGRLLILAMSARNNTQISSVTYNSQNMTLLARKGSGTDRNAEFWYLWNPPVGTNTLSATLSAGASNYFVITLACYYNVGAIRTNNTVSIDNAGTGTTSDIITTASMAADGVIDVICLQTGGSTPAASQTGQTSRYSGNDVNMGYGYSEALNASLSQKMGWTFSGSPIDHIAIDLLPSGRGNLTSFGVGG